ncbi:MAG TPA: PAS domain S-box protein, partial [Arenimonas sp.]|nr:PAS domain S-box protein [Arenimonas sp.]
MAETDARTDAVRLDPAIRANEERLRALIASAQDAVVIMDTQGLVVDWNPCAERMFGWTADEAIGARLSELIVPPHLRAQHEKGLRRYVETRQGHIIGRSVELTAVSRGGHEIPIELSLWPLESGGDLLFGAFIHDIYSRKAAERALREQEEKYRLVVENGSEGILVVREARIVFANPATERLVGVPLSEMQSAPFTNWIHADDRAMVVDRHLKRLRGEPVEKQYAFRILHPDGRLLWVELSAVSILWEGEQATLSFITDITQRKQLEESLQQTLGALQHRTHEQEAILQSTLIGIGLISERRFQWCNRTLAEMFHYTPEQLIGQPAAVLMPD